MQKFAGAGALAIRKRRRVPASAVHSISGGTNDD